jgi:hypothetical protein
MEAMVTPDKSNILFQLALDLVNKSSRSIFLTGKAGTGKTTFLKYLRQTCPKQIAIVAPTGVAAINAGGVTIHSFFQIPFAPYIPETHKLSGETVFSAGAEDVVSRNSLLNRLRINSERIKVLRQLELLIIDEVSMVRCDTMDAIDAVLRHIRKNPMERFGGVQVLFIGDMFQLPPVIKEPEWRLLSDYYESPYFFDSHVIREAPPLYIEFNKIYRQSEEIFIRLLNQVRNNRLDEEGMHILESRYEPAFHRNSEDGYIVLTTHNEKAREINRHELNILEGEVSHYNAEIKDEFPENGYPADLTLSLKPGAQVMFIKNDSDKSKRYFNGKIGFVTSLLKDKILVQCPHETDEIEVKPETWSNIRYTVDGATRNMQEETLGSFIQFPLRLAWAITIHKSQGLTFEKAIIDAGDAFAAGQVYVALSRCTSLEGMVLKSRVKKGSLVMDDRITRFAKNCQPVDQLEREYINASRMYQAEIIQSVFDLKRSLALAEDLKEYINKNETSFSPESLPWINGILESLNLLQATAIKFHGWIQAQFLQPGAPEENQVLQTRTKDGAIHFTKEINVIIGAIVKSPAETDSRLHAKEFNDSLKDLYGQLTLTLYLLRDFDARMDGEQWHQKKNSFVVPSFSINSFSGSGEQRVPSPHPVLLAQLKKVRDSICSKKDLPIYLVAGSKSLNEMVEFLPQTPEELEQITGFGKKRVETYGSEFLTIIQQYSSDKGLSSLISDKAPKHKKKDNSSPKADKKPKETRLKVDTKAESYRLYKEGLSIADIAKTRNFTLQTIEGHLAYYIQNGSISIGELLPQEKIMAMEPVMNDYTGGPITPLRERLGNDISYGDIRLFIAWNEYRKSIQSSE